MNKNLKVFILFASYGEGHLQASKALQHAFGRNGISQVELIDLFAEAHPMINDITKYLYMKSFTVLPSLYGWIYYRTKHMKPHTVFSDWLHSFGIRKLKERIQAESPDIVINTFPFLVMQKLKEETGIDIPTYNVLTDFDLHERWVHPQIDKYYVATEDLKLQVEKLGIPSERINVSGMPLKESFSSRSDAAECYRKFGLDPKYNTLLIMAGSYGIMQGIHSICAKLAERKDTQIALVCGKNKFLLAYMQKVFANHPHVYVYGFVHDICDLMAISTCIVTKPGGITLSESLSSNLPILLYRPVPGQELDNARYLVSKGAAVIAHKPKALAYQLELLLQDAKRLDRMRQSIAALQKTNSADNIVLDILNSVKIGREQFPSQLTQRRTSIERFS